ncbi:hypothetical protein HKD37_04G010190 [Glycine soja]
MMCQLVLAFKTTCFNKKRLDAIDKTNTSMLKAIYTLAKQDYKDSTKDGDKDVAMSETHDNTYVYRQPLHFQNVNKRVSNPTVKCTTNQAYGKSDATLNNIETIFILGDDDDDDDEFLRPLDKGMKGKFVRPSEKKTTDDSSPQQPFTSNYVRGLKAKAEIVKDSSIPPRTLSFPNDKSISGSSKKQKIDNHVQPTWNASGYQYSKGSSLGSINNNKPTWMFHRPQPNSSRGYTHTIPKDMPCTFKPTVDMNLNFEETQVCAYVFNPKVDPSGNEILFGLGNNLGTRAHFQSLCPNKPIREEIILFMALKVAYSQLYRTRSVWCMPPAFVVDVIDGTPVETVMLHYGKDWMPLFANLKLIYIPILENMDHWYLMVIDLAGKKIYHLDCDLTSQTTYDRKDHIKIMANAMLNVLESVFETEDLIFGFARMDNWDIVEPRGIPNYGSRMNANGGVICDSLAWSDEKAVRMKVAMILLLGTHNQYKAELITNAERTWHDSIHGKH